MSDFHIDPIMQEIVDRTKALDARPAPSVVCHSTLVSKAAPEVPNPEEFFELWRVNPEFYELLHRMAETHNIKAHDYCGTGRDPLANLMATEEIGIPAWKGCIIRMMDKWGRLKNFCRSETLLVPGESFEDTLLDNAVYSLLDIILYRRALRTLMEADPQVEAAVNQWAKGQATP